MTVSATDVAFANLANSDGVTRSVRFGWQGTAFPYCEPSSQLAQPHSWLDCPPGKRRNDVACWVLVMRRESVNIDGGMKNVALDPYCKALNGRPADVTSTEIVPLTPD